MSSRGVPRSFGLVLKRDRCNDSLAAMRYPSQSWHFGMAIVLAAVFMAWSLSIRAHLGEEDLKKLNGSFVDEHEIQRILGPALRTTVYGRGLTVRTWAGNVGRRDVWVYAQFDDKGKQVEYSCIVGKEQPILELVERRVRHFFGVRNPTNSIQPPFVTTGVGGDEILGD
jgi:hypothetical protein